MSQVFDDTQKGHAQDICIIFPLFVDDSNVNFARPFGLTLVLESPLNVSRCLILPFFPSNAISRHFLLGSSIRLDRHVSSISITKWTGDTSFSPSGRVLHFAASSAILACPSLTVVTLGVFAFSATIKRINGPGIRLGGNISLVTGTIASTQSFIFSTP